MITTFSEFLDQGLMGGVERRAADQAIAEARREWLPILEAWRASLGDDADLTVVLCLEGEIRRLRKLLRLPPPVSPTAAERRREQSRERQRRFRARRAGLPDS